MPTPRDADVDRVLIDGPRLAARVGEMARQITRDHADVGPGGLAVVPVLTGALVFAADLIRGVTLPLRIDLIAVSSYPGTSVTSQGTTVLQNQLAGVAGRRVVVLDDILDSGRTLQTVTAAVKAAGASSVKTCVLLRKKLPTPPVVEADYAGFEIPDEFVVGYGLDYDGLYRNLPHVAVLRPGVAED